MLESMTRFYRWQKLGKLLKENNMKNEEIFDENLNKLMKDYLSRYLGKRVQKIKTIEVECEDGQKLSIINQKNKEKIE